MHVCMCKCVHNRIISDVWRPRSEKLDCNLGHLNVHIRDSYQLCVGWSRLDSRREVYSLRKMLLLTQVRAKKLFLHGCGSGPAGCPWMRLAPQCADLPLWPSVQDSLGGGVKWSPAALVWGTLVLEKLLSVDSPGVNQNECPLCKPSNISGNRWKQSSSFCPQKHGELQRRAGWACFVGMSVCWIWNVQWRHFNFIDVPVEAFCFQTCQPRLFLHPGCPVSHTPGEHATAKPGWLMESWKSGHLAYKVPSCLCLLSGEKLLHNVYVRASKSPLARAWEPGELRWAPWLPLVSPSGRMGDP